MLVGLSGCEAGHSAADATVEGYAIGTGKPSAAGQYDPPIELTTIRAIEPSLRFDEGDSYADNPWIRAYERNLGIRVKTLWADDPGQYNRKLDLMIASGDIPDLFRVNANQLRQLIESGLIADLSDSYISSASPKVKKLLEERGGDPFLEVAVDGKLMAIPFMGMLHENAAVLHVRSDWLAKLKLQEPRTMDDVFAISKAFTTMDPDGNGKHDTFGLAVDQNFAMAGGLFNGYHAYRGIWIESGSKLAFGSIQPEMKSALNGLRQLYAMGQIDPDFGTKDEAKVAESIAGGKIGMFYGTPFAGSFPLQQAKKRYPEMEWKAFPIPSVDGNKALPQVSPGSGYWVVNKETRHPEAVFRLLDFWVETFYDNKSDDLYYEFNQTKDDNPAWKMNAIAITKEYKNVDESLRIIEAIETNDRSKLTPEDKGVLQRIEGYRKNGGANGWMWDYMFSKGGALSVADYYRRNDLYMRERFTSIPKLAFQRKNAELNKLQSETFMKIVLGLLPVDEFDRFAQRWRSLGGDDLTNEVNDWYAKSKSSRQ